MALAEILGLIVGNSALILPLFLWNRAESRADIRHMDAQLQANRDLIREVHKETNELINAMRDDMRDFHTRLCVNEEKNRDKK